MNVAKIMAEAYQGKAVKEFNIFFDKTMAIGISHELHE